MFLWSGFSGVGRSRARKFSNFRVLDQGFWGFRLLTGARSPETPQNPNPKALSPRSISVSKVAEVCDES